MKHRNIRTFKNTKPYRHFASQTVEQAETGIYIHWGYTDIRTHRNWDTSWDIWLLRHIQTWSHHRTTTKLDQRDVVTHRHWATGTEVYKHWEIKRHTQHANSHWSSQMMGHIKILCISVRAFVSLCVQCLCFPIFVHRYWNIHKHKDTRRY